MRLDIVGVAHSRVTPSTRTLALAPDLQEVARGRRFLSDIARDAGFSEDRVFDIVVACSEAMANAIEHSPVKGEVGVRAVVHSDRLEVEIQGPGEFQTPDRLKQRTTRGLGLPLMAKLSDHMALFSGPGGQTFVGLTFYLPGVTPRAAGVVPPAFADLSEKNKLLDDVLTHLPDGFVVVDDRWRIVYLNPAGADTARLTPDELVGRPLLEVFPDLKAGVVPLLEQAAAEGTVVRARQGRPGLWRELTVFPVEEGLALYSQDVTARMNAESEARSLLATAQADRERLARVIDSMTDEVWFADTHGRVTLANVSASEAFGLDGTDAPGIEEVAARNEVYRQDMTVRPPEEAPPLRALAGEVVRAEEEIVRMPLTGELRTRVVSAAPVRDAGGTVIGSVSVVRDVTEQRRAQERAGARDRLFRGMFENSFDALVLYSYVFDARGEVVDLVFEDVNRAAESISGISRQDFVGRRHTEVFGPDTLSRYLPDIAEMRRTGAPVAHGDPNDYVEPLGKYLANTFVPVDHDHFVVVTADVTDRVLSSEQSGRLMWSALRALPVVITAQDRDLRYLWSHDEHADRGPEFAGKTDQDLYPEQAEMLTTIKRDVMQTGVGRRHQFWLTTHRGRFFVDAHIEPVRDETGSVTGVITAGMDITEQHMVEEAFKRSEAELAYLVELDDALRDLDDADDMLATAVRMLGVRLSADRVFYREFPGGDDRRFFSVKHDFYAEGLTSAAGQYVITHDFDAALQEYTAGKTLWSADVYADPDVTAAQRERFLALGTRAHIGAPVIKRGRLQAILCVRQREPRQWIEEEIWLTEQTAERTWSAVERARASEALRQRQRELDLAMKAGRVVPFGLELTGDRLVASPGLYDLMALDPAAVTGAGGEWEAFIHEDDRRTVLAMVEKMWRTETEGHLEYRVMHGDGTVHWHEAHAAAMKGKDGSTGRLVGYITDITEHKRIEAELRESDERHRAIADHLQSALLDIPAEIGPVKLGHVYHSATEAARVGGDFYDVFEAKDGKIGVLVGDVSGHGIQAARTATLVKDVVHAFTHQSVKPNEVVKRTNALLVEREMPGFVSLFLGMLDPETGEFRYTIAGHPEMLLRRANGEVVGLGMGSAPLGVFEDAQWKPAMVELEQGDILLLYTDGALEARRGREMFGQKRLEALLKRKRLTVHRLPHMVLDQVLAFSEGTLQDDVAVLALTLTQMPSRGPRLFPHDGLLGRPC